MRLPEVFYSNTYTSWLAQVCKTLPYLIIPILIGNKFNPEFNAFWLLVMNIAGMLAFFDTGLLHNLARRFAYTAGNEGSPSAVSTLMQASSTSYLVMSLVFLFFTVCYYALVVQGNSEVGIVDQKLLWSMTVLSIGIRFYGNSIQALLYGLDRVYIFRWIEVFWYLVMFTGQVISLHANNQLIFCFAFCLGCVGITLSSLVARHFVTPQVDDRAAFDMFLMRDIVRKSAFAMMGQGWVAMLPMLFASWLVMSTDATVAYVGMLYVSCAKFAMLFCRTPFNSKLPKLSASWARNKKLDVVAFEDAVSKVVMLILLAMFGIVISIFLLHGFSDLAASSFLPLLFLVFACACAESFVGMLVQAYQITDQIISHIVNGLTVGPLLLLIGCLTLVFGELTPISLLIMYLSFLMVIAYPLALAFLRKILDLPRQRKILTSLFLTPIAIAFVGYII